MQSPTRAPTQIICTYLLKNDPHLNESIKHFREAAHNYTGQTGSMNSPGLFWYFKLEVCWRTPYLQRTGIIAANGHPSIPIPNICGYYFPGTGRRRTFS